MKLITTLERLKVDLGFHQRPHGVDLGERILSIYLWVTQRNVADSLAWHEASDVQSRAYMKRVQTEIAAAVKAICQGKQRTFSTKSSLSWTCE